MNQTYLENIIVSVETFQNHKLQKDKVWLYPQMIQAIKRAAADSIVRIFSPIKLSNLVNYERIIRQN